VANRAVDARNCMTSIRIILAAILAPIPLFGQSVCDHVRAGRTALAYGAQHVSMLQAPSGWVPDLEPGIPAAFHRVNETWRRGGAVMYANTWAVDSGRPKPPEQVIEEDSSHFAEASPKLRVEMMPSIRTADGREALLRRFLGDQNGNVEVVAYVRERTVTPLIVLSARSEAD